MPRCFAFSSIFGERSTPVICPLQRNELLADKSGAATEIENVEPSFVSKALHRGRHLGRNLVVQAFDQMPVERLGILIEHHGHVHHRRRGRRWCGAERRQMIVDLFGVDAVRDGIAVGGDRLRRPLHLRQ